uniref:Uncharacterized protein n=1 Tax=viral metagenome TaxID=1070528 RepID=A0A6C0I026_9ZZZZ
MPNKKIIKRSRKYKKRGGCGSCSNTSFLKGGSNNLDTSINHNQSVIPYNQSLGTSSDPMDSKSMIDTRMQPNMISGGKNKKNKSKKNNKKSRKTYKKIRGGIANINDPNTANAITSFGNTSGITSAFKILNATPTVDPSPLVQPVGTNVFGPHNPALV